MSDSLANLTAEVAQTAAVEQSAIAELVALVPVTIAIVNQSTVVTDAELMPVIEALKIQVIRDFAPAWGQDGKARSIQQGASGRDSTSP